MAKVRFNLKNIHYAVQNEGPEGNITFGTPVPVRGAVALDLEAQGDLEPFHADGITYYKSASNDGYNGDLEVALVPDQMLKDVWQYEETSDKVLVENANKEDKNVAILYQIDGDTTESLYCLFSCVLTRPTIGSKTKEKNKTPVTQKLKISAGPMPNGDVLARTTETTDELVKTNWFKEVYKRPVA